METAQKYEWWVARNTLLDAHLWRMIPATEREMQEGMATMELPVGAEIDTLVPLELASTDLLERLSLWQINRLRPEEKKMVMDKFKDTK